MRKTTWILTLLSFIYVHVECGHSIASQSLTMTISSTSNITTSGNPGTLTISLDSTGSGSATDSSTTYTVTSNSNASGTLQIVGAITSGDNMPSNTCLTATLASNAGTSLGPVELCSTAATLVNQLPTLLNDTAAITYTFRVINGWTVSSQALSRTVTLTLTAGS
ncbi:MAG: hypothetical protein K2Y01_09550 [Rhabdochlamydiaceae bacterium]|nr:hypothetical protein [Rhabdochlamydiaceae bacterium]